MSKRNIDPEFSDVYKHSFLKFFLIILIIGIIGYAGYYVYTNKIYKYVINYFSIDEEKEVKKEVVNTEKKKIYFYKDNNEVIYSYEENKDKDIVSTYVCSADNCNVLNNDDRYGLIEDNKYHIYDIENMIDTELGYDLKDKDNIHIIYSKDKLYGLLFNDTKLRYYSLDKNDVVYSSSTWESYEYSNLADLGYISLKTNSTCALLDLNTNSIVDSKVYDGVYTYYEGALVILSNDKYYLLNDKLEPMTEKMMYIRKSSDNIYYLFNNSKTYYSCNMDSYSCERIKSEYYVHDVINGKLLVVKNSNLYFAELDDTLGDKIMSKAGLTYSSKYSFYLDKDTDDNKKGLYLAFFKDGVKSSYEEYYLGDSSEVISVKTVNF